MNVKFKAWHAYLLIALTLFGLGALIVRSELGRGQAHASFTIGDVHAVHADVRIGDRTIRGHARISNADRVTTGDDGRARVRLDDGTLVVVGSATRFIVEDGRLSLETGKLFVQGGSASRTEVSLGNTETTVLGSAVAFERTAGAAAIYCAQGELLVDAAGQKLRVGSGETATLRANGASVAPEKAFDDWTGGLAMPWPGEPGQKSAIAQLRGGAGASELDIPLVVRAQHVDVRIEGETAITRTRTTYFNGSERSVDADVRLAIPPGAILARVARRDGASANASDAELRIAKPESVPTPGARLEWAGGGWLRGQLPSIAAGATVDLILEYVEWLAIRASRATYRFPMASDGEPPLVGELTARVDARATSSPWISANAGASIDERVVELRKTDWRLTSDFVVELSPAVVRPGAARAYVVPAPNGEDPFVMVRTEVPERSEPGVALAVVIDTSMSVGLSNLETERAVLDAILEGLGPRDTLTVFAADQTVKAVGPDTPQPVSDGLKAELRRAAAALRPGGASNLGLALEKAADVLDAPSRGRLAGSGMIVYVGDGRPTLGELDAESLRSTLSRRVGGIPRLSAIVVGPGADRFMLARLAAGAGSVYEVADRADAARAGAALLADALQPTLRDVGLDLGPSIDRVYPREARAALAGSTLTVVGRLRGDLPRQIGFRFRDGAKSIEMSRPLQRTPVPRGSDVARRWASLRVEEIAARGDGLEPAIALAHQYELLTPWTAFFFDHGRDSSSPFFARVLDLSPEHDAAFATHVDPAPFGSSSLLEPPEEFGGGVGLAHAAQIAMRRILQQAAGAIRACRDARAAVRPEVARQFAIDLSVSGEGRATNVRVVIADQRGRDAVLERCVQGVVQRLPYFAAGIAVSVHHTITLPEARMARRTQCSPTSRLSLPIRKGLWRARAGSGTEAYLEASKHCELPSWADKRAFLLLLLEKTVDAAPRLELANGLDELGETDAAMFVKRETLRRVSSFAELETLSRLVRDNEPDIDDVFDKAYQAATGDASRLAVVRRFLLLAPHDPLARRRLLALLEALGQRERLVEEIESIRSDPFADAGLLANAAAALRRIGLDAEGRRTFGELIERAPHDPWALAYVGDRFRAESMYDEAVAAYESLEHIIPQDISVALRLALAHAGAGRLDIATRLLERVTQTGGRGDDGRLGELASITQAVLLAEARTDSEGLDMQAEIVRRLMQTPLPDVASLLIVQAPPADDPVEVRVAREQGDQTEQPADLDARVLGLAAVRVERGDGSARILLSRKLEPGPKRPTRAKVAALVLSSDRGASRLVTREVDVLADGKSVELRWNGETFL